MTRKSLIVLLLMSIVNCQLSSVFAQDAQLISQTDLIGTARYVAMAGAMTAVGGDPTAVKDNPAGLGVYRRLEVGLTLCEDLDKIHQAEYTGRAGRYNTFSVSQASLIFSLMNNARSRGMISNNLILSYQRLANYNRRYVAGLADEDFSLSHVIADKTNGLKESALQPDTRWDDPEVGWLSCQAYDTYLINPDGSQWSSLLMDGQQVSNYMTVTETGYLNQYTVGWGTNISNKIFLGASLNMMSVYRNQTVQYSENFGDGCGLKNNTYVALSGLGIGASIGIIAHPVRWLRIGASFTTPSALTLTTTSYGDLASYVYFTDSTGTQNLVTFTSQSPQNRVTDRSMRLPLRTSVGLAFQLKKYGLLSVQYDYAHQKEIQDTHAFRVGLEGVIVNRFFLSAGYAVEGTKTGWHNITSSSKAVSAPCELAYNTVRTDAYSLFANHSHYITTGFGYRTTHFSVHAAYRLRMQQMDMYAHELATPYDMRAMSHSIVVSFGFHSK